MATTNKKKVSADNLFAEFEASAAAGLQRVKERLGAVGTNHTNNGAHTGITTTVVNAEDTSDEIVSPSKSRFHGALLERAKSQSGGSVDHSNFSTRQVFQSLVLKTIEGFADPWAHHNIDKIPAERVRSYRYSSQNKSWHVEESLVKIQSEPFDSGEFSCARSDNR
jgi:hypothetical protein